jgi:hypothetical protein
MTSPFETESILDTIAALALDIARQCPDCAENATRIASLAGQVKAMPPDRGAIQDALESRMADSDISDTSVRSTTEAIVEATAADLKD